MCRFILKNLEEKKYPFPDFDVPNMLEDLLQKKVIELPECKHPEKMGYVNDPNYCHYHRIVSHPMEKCCILKDLIMKLAKQRRIHLDLDEVVESNHATVTFGSFDPIPLHAPLKKLRACTITIQCDSMKPKETQVSCRDGLLCLCSSNESMCRPPVLNQVYWFNDMIFISIAFFYYFYKLKQGGISRMILEWDLVRKGDLPFGMKAATRNETCSKSRWQGPCWWWLGLHRC